MAEKQSPVYATPEWWVDYLDAPPVHKKKAVRIPPALSWLADLLRLNQVPGDDHLHRFGKRLHKAFRAKQPNKRIGEAFGDLQHQHPDAVTRLVEIVRDCCRLPADRPTTEAQEGALAALERLQAGDPATNAFGFGRRPGPRKGFTRAVDAVFLCRYIELLEQERQARGEGMSEDPPERYAYRAVVEITGVDRNDLRAALQDPTLVARNRQQLVMLAMCCLGAIEKRRDEQGRDGVAEQRRIDAFEDYEFEIEALFEEARRLRGHAATNPDGTILSR